ncbi:YczE/YyaS/YitT family protein [Bacillus benzoevorans]|nr:YitT family protein [Bacillus benzoevorans]
MMQKRKGQIGPRFMIYLIGLLIMSLGIVFLIIADLGPSPWDVLHVGLFLQFGLTIGTWNIIAGLFILTLSALISKSIPQFGAFLNMILVGLFIDMYMLLPFMQTPSFLIGKILMFATGLILSAYGMGIYISAQLGAGPRDSLMLAVTSKTGWKIGYVRNAMEILALISGWLIGGPVYWGTIVISFMLGTISGYALPQCQRLTDIILTKLNKETHQGIY